ncbi:MAG: DUF4177 domain-containing protein [Polyangiaceae bacterium]|jgi:hypothetical protein|nr:DUF4177 domain-containing protein [Polyangiaceae bacterium]
MERWDYKCLRFGASEFTENVERELNALGAEGWEVVAVVPGERHGYSHDATFIMKRPRS